MNDDLRKQFVSLMIKCSKLNTAFPSLCEMPVNEMGILHMITESNSDNRDKATTLDIQHIQEQLQISKPAISYILNSLEQKEYIIRRIDTKDRRRISVEITQEGATAWEFSKQKHEDMWEQLIKEFGEDNMNQLIQLLTQLFNIIDNYKNSN